MGVQIGDNNVSVTTVSLQAPRAPAWPLLVGRPPRQAACFETRPTLTSAVERMLDRGEQPVEPIVICGNGGIGKTQLAAALLRSWEPGTVDLRMWVSGASRTAVLAAYERALGTVTGGARWADGPESAADELLSWLATTTRRWLLVLDDVMDPADIVRLVPEAGPGRVVVTTRRRDVARRERNVAFVETFTPREAVRYLRRKLAASKAVPTRTDVRDGAHGLATDLGFLPLALAQAAAVIVDDGITCAAYRRRFADRSTRLARLFPKDAHADEYALTVATAWSLAVERADALHPAGLARPALAVAAAVDGTGAPEQLWATTAIRRYLTTRRPRLVECGTERSSPGNTHALVDAHDARLALRRLDRLSLISHDPQGGPRSVRTHALVQRAAVDQLEDTDIAALATAVADGIADLWPTDATTEEAEALRDAAAAVIALASDGLWRPEPHAVFGRLGRDLAAVGLVREAVHHWRSVAEQAESRFGAEHPATLLARRSLAYRLGEAGDPAAAIVLLQSVLRAQERTSSTPEAEVLTTRNLLAYWVGLSGDAAGAIAGFEQVLAGRTRVLGPDHEDTFTTRNDLAAWRGEAGDPAAAAAELGELLADQAPVLGTTHPRTLITRHNLARWLGEAGRPDEAVDLLVPLVIDQRHVHGADSPDTFLTRHALARWRGVAGDAAAAVDDFEALVADQERAIGPDHPDTLFSRANLAHWLLQDGNPDDALPMLDDVLTRQAQLLSDDHPYTLITRTDLAEARGATDPDQAVAGLERVLADRRRILGDANPQTLATRSRLGNWRGRSGDLDGAVDELEAAADAIQRCLSSDHPLAHLNRERLIHWQIHASRRR